MAQNIGLFEERPHGIGNFAAFLAVNRASRHEYQIVTRVYFGYHKTNAFPHLSFDSVSLHASAHLFGDGKPYFKRSFGFYEIQNEILV